MLIPYAGDAEATEPASAGTGKLVQTYVEFTDTRRMRSREVHYIDHPLVGIIILATPFKISSDKGKTGAPGTYQTL